MLADSEQLDNRPKAPDIKKSEDGKPADAISDAGNKSVDAAQESLRAVSEITKIETDKNKFGVRVLIPLDQSGTRFTIGQNFYNQGLLSPEGSFGGLTRRLFGSVDFSVGAGIAHRGDEPAVDSGMALNSKYGGARVSLRDGLPVLDSAFVKGNLLGTDIALGGSYNPTRNDTLNLIISKKLNIHGADTKLSLEASTERRNDKPNNDEPNIDNRITANLNIYGF